MSIMHAQPNESYHVGSGYDDKTLKSERGQEASCLLVIVWHLLLETMPRTHVRDLASVCVVVLS